MVNPLNVPANLINFDFSGESRCEVGLRDLEIWWVMYANIKESTCIYLKIDETHVLQHELFEA